MTNEELKVIDDFIDWFEPWQSNFEFMAKMQKDGSTLEGCVFCGIRPDQVKKLRDAIEKMRDSK